MKNRWKHPNQGIVTLIHCNVGRQDSLGENNLSSQLTEPSQISNEIQVWTQVIEQKECRQNFNKKEKNWITNLCVYSCEAILKETRTSKKRFKVTICRFETNETQNTQLSGSKNDMSKEVLASNNVD